MMLRRNLIFAYDNCVPSEGGCGCRNAEVTPCFLRARVSQSIRRLFSLLMNVSRYDPLC